MNDSGGRDPYAWLADEATRLLQAWQDSGGALHDHGEGTSPVACRACPLCRLLAAVHHLRPEVVEHLADAADSLAAALAGLAAGQACDRGRSPSSERAETGGTTRSGGWDAPTWAGDAPLAVQHIEVTD